MTLDTRVYVHDKVDAMAVFIKMNQLLGATEATKCRTDNDSIRNQPRQGLPAWLIVYCDPAGQKPRRADPSPCDEDCEEYREDYGSCERNHRTPCWLEVSIDTTYGYRGEDDEGCSELHARLITELGSWLDKRGVRWSWQNEFTDEVHSRYNGLVDFAGSGIQAAAWFQDTVIPAIEKMTASETE